MEPQVITQGVDADQRPHEDALWEHEDGREHGEHIPTQAQHNTAKTEVDPGCGEGEEGSVERERCRQRRRAGPEGHCAGRPTARRRRRVGTHERFK